MTFQTTDSISISAVIICVVIFIAVSITSGILSYKLKIRKLRQNREKDNENRKR